MFSMLGTVMGTLRLARGARAEPCLVCDRAVRSRDEAVPVAGGGHVHRGCATYRMRQHARAVRQIASY